MCGHLLVGKPESEAEYAVKTVPRDSETPAAKDTGVSPAERTVIRPTDFRREAVEEPPAELARAADVSVARPVEFRREAIEEPPAEIARAAEPVIAEPAKSNRWWVDENETTLGGPSFLGLSNADSEGGSYSYLFQEEERRSHKAVWVFMLVLLVLGGVVYAKWRPLRDYVLTMAVSHSRPQQPAAENNNAQSIPPSSAPTTTLASSDAQAPPAIITENKVDQKKAEPTKAADATKLADGKEGLPQGNKQAAADSSKAEVKPGAKQGEEQASAAKDEAPSDEEDTPAADEEKPPKRARAAAQASQGGELVSSGERYLYGRGVPRSCDQAVSYFNAAAAKQNPQAFSHLGALYATGECVPMDRAMAYAWFRRAYAKEPANHYFEQNLTMLWREMTPDEKLRATGR